MMLALIRHVMCPVSPWDCVYLMIYKHTDDFHVHLLYTQV